MLWLPSERGGLHRQFAVRRSILVCDVMPAYREPPSDKEVNKELPEDDLIED